MTGVKLNKHQDVGVVLSIFGNLSITIGMNLQKHVHNQIQANDCGEKYTRKPWWWLGMFLMALGEGGNFLAYAYAPATLVAPLGSVSVMSNAVIAHVVLKEPVTVREMLGLLACVAGSIGIVMCAPHSDVTLTMPLFEKYIQKVPFILFICLVIALVCGLLMIPPRLKQRYVVCYLSICGLLGSITVTCTKGLATAFVLTLAGDDQFLNFLTYILIVAVVVTVVCQVRQLNKAMMSFGASIVVPVYYVIFSFMAVLAGIILLRENQQSFKHSNILFVFSCLVTFSGVFLITFATGSRSRTSSLLSVPDDMPSDIPSPIKPARHGDSLSGGRGSMEPIPTSSDIAITHAADSGAVTSVESMFCGASLVENTLRALGDEVPQLNIDKILPRRRSDLSASDRISASHSLEANRDRSESVIAAAFGRLRSSVTTMFAGETTDTARISSSLTNIDAVHDEHGSSSELVDPKSMSNARPPPRSSHKDDLKEGLLEGDHV